MEERSGGGGRVRGRGTLTPLLSHEKADPSARLRRVLNSAATLAHSAAVASFTVMVYSTPEPPTHTRTDNVSVEWVRSSCGAVGEAGRNRVLLVQHCHLFLLQMQE